MRDTARRVVRGQVRAIDGARWIWREASDRVVEKGDLRVFVGLASEWDDWVDGRAEIARRIIDEAELLLRRPAPRRWAQLRAERGFTAVRAYRTSGYTEVDLATLPLSQALRSDLGRWAVDYDAMHDGFASQPDAVAFVSAGKQLAQRLQTELGDGWYVEYWPEPTLPPVLRLQGAADRPA